MNTIITMVIISLLTFSDVDVFVSGIKSDVYNMKENIEIVQKSIINVTYDNFEEKVLKSEKLVIVDFAASWCGPCKKLEPVLEQIGQTHDELTVVKVDVDGQDARKLMEKYGVSSYPTMIIIRDGEEVGRMRGYNDEEKILKYLEDK